MLPEVLNHPHKAPVFLVRVDYIHMCQDAPDPHAAGFILSLIEYWTRVKAESNKQAIIANSLADEPTQDTSLWVYKTEDELKAETLGLFGDKKLRANREWLIEQGFLFKRNNPKIPSDRTLQFHLGFKAIQKALDGMSYASDHVAELPDGPAELPHDPAELPHDPAKLPDASGRNAGTIPKTTTETTPETTTESDSRTDVRTPPLTGGSSSGQTKGRNDRDDHQRVAPTPTDRSGLPQTPCGRHIVKAIGRGTKKLSPSEEKLLNHELTAFDGGKKRTFTLNELYDTEPLFGEWIDVLAGKLYNRWRSDDRPIPKAMMFTALTTGGGEGRYKVNQSIQDYFDWKETRAATEALNAQSYAPIEPNDLDERWAMYAAITGEEDETEGE